MCKSSAELLVHNEKDIQTTSNANVDRAVHFFPLGKPRGKPVIKILLNEDGGWIRIRGDSVMVHCKICPGNQRTGIPGDRAALFLDGIQRVFVKFGCFGLLFWQVFIKWWPHQLH